MKRGVALWLVLVALLVGAAPARSQLLLVTGDYRVVELDKANNRIGVSLPESKPDVRQNWIYVKLETEVVRHQERDGWSKDEVLTPEALWSSVQKGDMMRVQGGRGWDGTITAKKIWLGVVSKEG